MNKNLTLIDADSLAYICGNTETLEEAIKKVDERIDNIVRNTNANYISLFISKGKYFRHLIDSNYKANRGISKLKWMRSIKSYLEDKYEANWMANVEADDLVSYWMNNKILYNEYLNIIFIPNLELKDNIYQSESIEINKIMSAIDKDLLFSIPGKHWNFTYKSEDSKVTEGYWVETSLEDSVEFKAMQLLHGDSGDSVYCLDKVGPVKARKLLDNWKDGDIESFILSIYIDFYKNSSKGIFEFQKNYRLLHMLENDEDFIREVGEVPKFPNIIKIKEDVKEDIF